MGGGEGGLWLKHSKIYCLLVRQRLLWIYIMQLCMSLNENVQLRWTFKVLGVGGGSKNFFNVYNL